MDRQTHGFHPSGLGERLSGAAFAGLIVATLVAALIWGLADRQPRMADRREPALVWQVTPPLDRPVTPPKPRRLTSARDAAAPPNLRDQATPVTAPPPVVPLAAPPPLVVAPRPAAGAAPQTGASDRAGPGSGAGGEGDGSGGGGSGDGDGYTPPRQIRGRLKYSDLPPEVVHDQSADGTIGAVGVRYHVDTDGRVTECAVTASSGKPALDQMTCRLIRQRFRFKPSRDPAGRPVGSNVIETHTWDVVHDDDGPAPQH